VHSLSGESSLPAQEKNSFKSTICEPRAARLSSQTGKQAQGVHGVLLQHSFPSAHLDDQLLGCCQIPPAVYMGCRNFFAASDCKDSSSSWGIQTLYNFCGFVAEPRPELGFAICSVVKVITGLSRLSVHQLTPTSTIMPSCGSQSGCIRLANAREVEGEHGLHWNLHLPVGVASL
jgi:hypothetical protein